MTAVGRAETRSRRCRAGRDAIRIQHFDEFHIHELGKELVTLYAGPDTFNFHRVEIINEDDAVRISG